VRFRLWDSLCVAHQEICRLCRISKTTLTTYLKQYQDGGLERLKEFGYAGSASALDEQAASHTTEHEHDREE